MRIFISYRHNDAKSATGRIHDHLQRAGFRIYRDTQSIPGGVNFVQHLNEALNKCDVLIAVIGPHWAASRLLAEEDFVRLEIETCIARGIRVIPVLVEGANLPTTLELPESLRSLTQLQALRIDSGDDFENHAKRLVNAIDEYSTQLGAWRRFLDWFRRRRAVGVAAAGLTLAAILAILATMGPRQASPAPSSSAATTTGASGGAGGRASPGGAGAASSPPQGTAGEPAKATEAQMPTTPQKPAQQGKGGATHDIDVGEIEAGDRPDIKIAVGPASTKRTVAVGKVKVGNDAKIEIANQKEQ